jgi:hypothetical protein
LAPEKFFDTLRKTGLDVTTLVTTAVTGGRPNAVHHWAAALLRHGGRLWTSNVDELIEFALGSSISSVDVLCYPDDPSSHPHARFVKPHGSLSKRDFVFEIDQVLRPLPDGWSDRLRADFDGAMVALCGYAGADFDLRWPLRDALQTSASAIWFEVPDTVNDSAQRIEARPSCRTAAASKKQARARKPPSDIMVGRHAGRSILRRHFECMVISTQRTDTHGARGTSPTDVCSLGSRLAASRSRVLRSRWRSPVFGWAHWTRSPWCYRASSTVRIL